MEPEFGSYAGQLDTGHGARTKAPSTWWGVPLPREREFEEIITIPMFSLKCTPRFERIEE